MSAFRESHYGFFNAPHCEDNFLSVSASSPQGHLSFSPLYWWIYTCRCYLFALKYKSNGWSLCKPGWKLKGFEEHALLMNKVDRVSNKKWHLVKPSFLVCSQHCAPTVQGPVCFFYSLLKGSLYHGSVNKIGFGPINGPYMAGVGLFFSTNCSGCRRRKGCTSHLVAEF